MSDWKVEKGTCDCPIGKEVELPIPTTPDNNSGLCPLCFSEGKADPKITKEKLDLLSEEERELLFRNLYNTTIQRKHTTTTRYHMAKFRLESDELLLFRFSWGKNPDPEEVRRLLYDDVPWAVYELERSLKDYSKVQIKPVLICDQDPSRKNSAWDSILHAAKEWPRNPTHVDVNVYEDLIIQGIERLLKELKRRNGNAI